VVAAYLFNSRALKTFQTLFTEQDLETAAYCVWSEVKAGGCGARPPSFYRKWLHDQLRKELETAYVTYPADFCETLRQLMYKIVSVGFGAVVEFGAKRGKSAPAPVASKEELIDKAWRVLTDAACVTNRSKDIIRPRGSKRELKRCSVLLRQTAEQIRAAESAASATTATLATTIAAATAAANVACVEDDDEDEDEDDDEEEELTW
jgi:hypothetical protein